ncbi:hypothetical protein C2845_PM14G08270 [Panicum miliaceum]|uniref:Transposase (putative) gypsy type domain-containing protein n=1 Tax=Panicum miliaceum TaxID=4540 RepID=A0A3L6PNC7_PANMI|nr:hypothetical protein C2845_PM14G08270 [Panicum miliaceum]
MERIDGDRGDVGELSRGGFSLLRLSRDGTPPSGRRSPFLRATRLPAHRFFRGFLDTFSLELQHLTSNLVLQLAAFVTLCESFLGIKPHKALFLRLFEVRGQTPSGQPGPDLAVVGGGLPVSFEQSSRRPTRRSRPQPPSKASTRSGSTSAILQGDISALHQHRPLEE